MRAAGSCCRACGSSFRPPGVPEAVAFPPRGAADAAPRAELPSPGAAVVAAVRRTDAVASACSSLIGNGNDQRGGGRGESPESTPGGAPYPLRHERCGVPAAALCSADSNRLPLGPSCTQERPKPRGLQLFGLLPPWCTPNGDSPRPPPVSRRASSPSSPPAAPRRARGAHERARRLHGGAGPRPPSASS
jgi:hypothetical protein